MGSFRKLAHISNVESLFTSSYFTYAQKKEEKSFWAWGFGAGFVLGNGQEESLFKARQISNLHVFKDFPLLLSLGTNHVSYISGTLGNEEVLQRVIL